MQNIHKSQYYKSSLFYFIIIVHLDNNPMLFTVYLIYSYVISKQWLKSTIICSRMLTKNSSGISRKVFACLSLMNTLLEWMSEVLASIFRFTSKFLFNPVINNVIINCLIIYWYECTNSYFQKIRITILVVLFYMFLGDMWRMVVLCHQLLVYLEDSPFWSSKRY